jgi:hypothetical protein
MTKIIKATTAGIVAKKAIEKTTGQKSTVRKRDILATALSSGSVTKTIGTATRKQSITAKPTEPSSKKSKTSASLSTLVGGIKIAHQVGKKTLEKQALTTKTSINKTPVVLNKHQKTAKDKLDQLAKENEAAVKAQQDKALSLSQPDEPENENEDDDTDQLFTEREKSLLRD